MTTNLDDRAGPPAWSFAGFKLGLRLALPVLPGLIAFGLAVGATAARKGFSFIESAAMNLFVYAGMSQLVAMEVWPEHVTIGALAALALLCAVINARMLLDHRLIAAVAWTAAAVEDLSIAAHRRRSRLADCHALSRRRRV